MKKPGTESHAKVPVELAICQKLADHSLGFILDLLDDDSVVFGDYFYKIVSHILSSVLCPVVKNVHVSLWLKLSSYFAVCTSGICVTNFP